MAFSSLLRPASFRGIKFSIFDAEMAFGRRNVLHEYPYRDTPYGEDLGRKGREITLNAFLMITTDFSVRNQLIAAIEDNDTPGTLVHPTLGSMTVIPKECRVRYNNLEGGIEYFTLSFVEAGDGKLTATAIDTGNVSAGFAANLKTAAGNFFSSNYKTTGYPSYIPTQALYTLNKLSKQISKSANFGGAGNDTSGKFSILIGLINQFNTNLPSLVFDTAALAAAITDLNAALNAAFADNLPVANQVQNQMWAWGATLAAVIDTTTLGLIVKDNQATLIILVKTSVISELINNVAATRFISLNQAIETQNTVSGMAQELLLELADSFDDDLYTSLVDAVDAMVENIQAQALTLAQVKTVSLNNNLPALVVAYAQYNDASQDLALVEQNNIINPGFIPAGTELMVLS